MPSITVKDVLGSAEALSLLELDGELARRICNAVLSIDVTDKVNIDHDREAGRVSIEHGDPSAGDSNVARASVNVDGGGEDARAYQAAILPFICSALSSHTPTALTENSSQTPTYHPAPQHASADMSHHPFSGPHTNHADLFPATDRPALYPRAYDLSDGHAAGLPLASYAESGVPHQPHLNAHLIDHRFHQDAQSITSLPSRVQEPQGNSHTVHPNSSHPMQGRIVPGTTEQLLASHHWHGSRQLSGRADISLPGRMVTVEIFDLHIFVRDQITRSVLYGPLVEDTRERQRVASSLTPNPIMQQDAAPRLVNPSVVSDTPGRGQEIQGSRSSNTNGEWHAENDEMERYASDFESYATDDTDSGQEAASEGEDGEGNDTGDESSGGSEDGIAGEEFGYGVYQGP